MIFIDTLNTSLNAIIQQTKANSSILGVILCVTWVIFFLSRIDKRILLLGIIPRHFIGLPGIIFAPLLHANFNHLFFNSIPLLVLSNFILVSGLDYYLMVTIKITLLSGFAIWCFAKPGLHIGASGLITGYWGLLVINIYQQASLTNIMLGLISVYYFAGIFLGIFPRKRGVSWEGHLFGLLSGLSVGVFLI